MENSNTVHAKPQQNVNSTVLLKKLCQTSNEPILMSLLGICKVPNLNQLHVHVLSHLYLGWPLLYDYDSQIEWQKFDFDSDAKLARLKSNAKVRCLNRA